MRTLVTGIALITTFVTTPAFASGDACASPDFARQAAQTLRTSLNEHGFSGVVLVAVGGKPVFRRAVGFANREWAVPNTADTRFLIASISKQFTAAAILQLAEQHKLSVEDPISQYYPDAPPTWSKITLKNLLTHTSGIPDYTTAPRFRERDARLAHSLDDLINLVRDKPLDFEPGSKMAYNNMGYVLLAYTIEKVSKQTYADYLRAHIFGPLGMRNTGVASSVTIIPKLASGYSAGRGGVVNASPVDMSNFTGPGALYSTVDDLLIWDQALYAGKVLNAASSTAMFADYGHNYGFGWQVDRKWDRDRVWHSGDINGFSTMFQRYPMDRVTVVALSNYDGSFPGRIATDLAGLCLGFPLPVYPPEVSLSIINLDHFVGDYQYAPGVIFKVVRDGPRLKALVEGSGPVPLYPMSPSEFFAKLVDAHMIFQIDKQGEVTGMVLRQRGRDQLLKRIAAGAPK